MNLAELCRNCGLSLKGPAGCESRPIEGITHDSRRVKPGFLYVALCGRTVDGRRFIPGALEKGAAAVALQTKDAAPELIASLKSTPYIELTDDPRKDLALLSAEVAGHPIDAMRLAAVTGTNGKTTTATLISEMIEASGIPSGLIGTIEERIGQIRRPSQFTTPEAPDLQQLFCEMRDAHVQALAMEFSSIGLEEKRVYGLPVLAAGFTGLTPDHLDYHGTMAAYGASKRRLFEENLRPDGIAVLNCEDPFGEELASGLKCNLWRLKLEDPNADVHFESLQLSARGIEGLLVTPKGRIALKSPLVGRFNAHNLALASSMAQILGIPDEAIARAASKAFVRGRLQPVPLPPGRKGPAIFVDYAHTPDALERVIEVLKPLCHGQLWCLFGCGGDRDATKRPLMGRAAALADGVILTTDNPRTEDPKSIAMAAFEGLKDLMPQSDHLEVGHCHIELDRRTAIRKLIAQAQPEDTLLIAGKGHETYQEIGHTRSHFDDLEEAMTALQAQASGRTA